MENPYWIKKFKIYLKNQHPPLTVSTFAKKNGMQQPTLWRLVTGKTKQATVRIAKDIEAGTGGEIRASEILGLY